MNRIFRSAVFYLILIIAVVWIFQLYRRTADQPEQLQSVNQVQSAKFLTKDEKVVGQLSDGRTYEVFLPKDTVDDMANFTKAHDVAVSADPQQGSVFLSVLFQFLPILIIVGFFFFHILHAWITAVTAKTPPTTQLITFWLLLRLSTSNRPPKIKIAFPIKVPMPIPAI